MIEPKVNQNVQVGGIVLMLALCFANMKEIMTKVEKIVHRHFEGIFLEGLEICAYIIPGFKLVRHSLISYVLLSKVCFITGTSEVIPSLVGNDTAILLSFQATDSIKKKPK